MNTPRIDASAPLAHRDARAYSTRENPALTAFVSSLWDALLSREALPRPPCPHCAGSRTRLHAGANQHHAVPYFRCADCDRMFTRLTGSPIARLRFRHKMPAFIRLLSQPIPLAEASRRLGVDYEALSSWLMRYRELIAQHDADETWTPLVLLGIKYRPLGRCPKCAFDGTLLNGGFDADRRRRAKCPRCQATWRIALSAQGEDVAVEIVEDLALNAATRRRKVGKAAPTLPAMSHAALRAAPAKLVAAPPRPKPPSPEPERFDFRQRLRSRTPAAAGDDAEDEALTRFLMDHIARVCSDSVEPPACARCGSTDTQLAARPRRAGALPQFHCRACTRYFTRATGTPLSGMLRKDVLLAFVPWLSRQRPLAHAARTINMQPKILKQWVRRFREWLLALDPSGEHERRVRLGLKAPWPALRCPRCGETAPSKPHGFKRTRTQSDDVQRQRLFRCGACQHFFDLPIALLKV